MQEVSGGRKKDILDRAVNVPRLISDSERLQVEPKVVTRAHLVAVASP